jgi:ABC-type uncharacterized transport system ATPase subunit
MKTETGEAGSESQGIGQREPVVELRGITKSFAGVRANDSINFTLMSGEVHALLGENGAGKTTLMNILYGLYQPDEGEIFINGKQVRIRSPQDAISLGIGMVHQHFMLIPTLTVLENVILGIKSQKSILTDRADVRKRILEISEKYGLKIDPDAKVWQLSVGEKQRVEIVKALYRGAKILILDEPTAVLTPPEIVEITKIIRLMADQGLCVIPFITHKLPEVMAVSDRVTVLRQGKLVTTVDTKSTNERDLAMQMVGREIVCKFEKHECGTTKVLDVRDVSALDDKGLPALKGISFSICEGEILGLAGVSGNGQKELEQVLAGVRKVTNGQILVKGKDVTNKSTNEILRDRVSVIPEDRVGNGMAGTMSIAENLILSSRCESPFASKGPLPFANRWFTNTSAIDDHANRLVQEFDIRTPSIHMAAQNLSGGNIQRLILAREISRNPELLIVSQPTRGLDVAATEFIRRRLCDQKQKGAAILLISDDLNEVLDLSDRVAVIYRGEIAGIVAGDECDISKIGLMMAGAAK